ncbi:hypothetical protein Saso_01960 [Streptomyces asoensis]|uniref:Uncharacterized protein n=1 Tax=Streptomyces asoensis TaxID=249586 RepID=A0ABQ3RRQ7_9ACTN|nr:hypothetical protein GCM10010496_02890 [Streptomyces asoensis]GHI58546.1 hypothetical protein Saso_01960 [Streptomyces asoensis]
MSTGRPAPHGAGRPRHHLTGSSVPPLAATSGGTDSVRARNRAPVHEPPTTGAPCASPVLTGPHTVSRTTEPPGNTGFTFEQ